MFSPRATRARTVFMTTMAETDAATAAAIQQVLDEERGPSSPDASEGGSQHDTPPRAIPLHRGDSYSGTPEGSPIATPLPATPPQTSRIQSLSPRK